ncbi:MAG: hypothetical protein L0211_25925 [Planctomycetaceae bacterium]|nr:hypothetical protein [Planctomycetaceae bacterium]
MRNTLLLIGAFCFGLVAAGLVGCGGSLPPAAERLPGKWQGQMIVYEETVAGRLTPEQISELSQKQMGLEFAADGSMITSADVNGQSSASSGRWEVVTQQGDLITIKSTEQGGKSKDVNIEFDGADTFYIPLKTEVAELGAMKFTRMR